MNTLGNAVSGLVGSKMYARLWLMALGRTIPFGDSNVSPHETVDYEGGMGIDRVIAPMIESLWAAGIETFNSCQGDPVLDESAFRSAPNFYDSCYGATVTVGNVDDAYAVMTALDAAMTHFGFGDEAWRVRTTFGVKHGVFVNFPAKLLEEHYFLTVFKEELSSLAHDALKEAHG